jgi:hypothetical protein
MKQSHQSLQPSVNRNEEVAEKLTVFRLKLVKLSIQKQPLCKLNRYWEEKTNIFPSCKRNHKLFLILKAAPITDASNEQCHDLPRQPAL